MEKELGKWGENRACTELINKGHTIITRNYKGRFGEVDIISRKDDFIVITEVKTRASRYLSAPGNTISHKKQRTIIKVADQFIKESDLDQEVRFDVVTIIKNSVMCSVDHIEGAFYPH